MYLTSCESEEFLVSVFSRKRNKIVGQVSLGTFCMWYALHRFFIWTKKRHF